MIRVRDRKYHFLLAIAGSLLLNSCQGSGLKRKVGKNEIQNSRCEVVYHFSNPSLGPILGDRTLKLFLRKGKVERVIDLKTGKLADPSLGTPGLKEVIMILGKTPSDGEKTIEKKSTKMGGFYRIEIKTIRCHD